MYGKGSYIILQKHKFPRMGTITPLRTLKSVEISVVCVFHWDSHMFSLLSLSLYLPLCVSLTMLKAIVALKPSETLEERTGGVESHPAACGL